MIYVTGDTHGDFTRIKRFCAENNTTLRDTLIILGDAGINYYLNEKDRRLKEKLNSLSINLFCVHGNHEARPENIETYAIRDTGYDGQVYAELEFPHIMFAKDGEIYDFEGKEYLVVGGAYSVDKWYRLKNGGNWWPDEQPSDGTKKSVESLLSECQWHIHGVLSHTCPLKYEPVEAFLPNLNQSTIDKTTEQWLDSVEDKLAYDYWYCGHYHINKNIDKMRFRFEEIEVLK